jgi:hypothetical protein
MFGAHLLRIIAATGFYSLQLFEHVKPSTSVLYARCDTWNESQALVCVFDANVVSSERRPWFSDDFRSQHESEHEDQNENDIRGKFWFNRASAEDVKDDASEFKEEDLEGLAEKLKIWIL